MKRYEIGNADVPRDKHGIATEPCLMFSTGSRTKAEQFWAAQRAQGRRVWLYDARNREEIHGPDGVPQ